MWVLLRIQLRPLLDFTSNGALLTIFVLCLDPEKSTLFGFFIDPVGNEHYLETSRSGVLECCDKITQSSLAFT